MRAVKQSTNRNVMVFMTDSADHVTGKTGLTLTITASKDGAAFASISPTVTERGSGWYNLALTTSHTDTLGDLAIHVTSSGADPSDLILHVVAYDFADAVRLGLSALPNAAAEASGGLVTRGTGTGQISVSSGAVIVQAGTGTGQLDIASGRIKADTVYWNGSAVSAPTNAGVPNVNVKTWNDLTTVDLPLAPTTAGRKLDVSAGGEAGLDWANIGSPTTVVNLSGTTVKTATDVETDTADIQSRLPAALTADGNIKADALRVGGTVQTGGDLANLITTVDNVVDTILVDTNELQTDLVNDGRLDLIFDSILADTNELQTDWANGGRLDLILDARASQTTADSILEDTAEIGAAGAGLTALPWNASWDAEIQSEVQDAIEANNLDHLVKVAVDTNFATTVHLDSIIGHLADNGTTATFSRSTDSLEALRDRGDAAWITATGFSTHSAADVWAVATRVLTAGTNIVLAKGTGITGFNDLSAAAVNAEVDTAISDVGLTSAVTGRIDATISSRLAGSSYTAPDNSSITAILEDTGTTIPAQISALNNLSAAQVKTQVVNAISVDANALPGQGDPTVTPTVTGAIMYMYKSWRNKNTQTDDTWRLYADDGTTVDQKATVSDDGTVFVRGEITSGA